MRLLSPSRISRGAAACVLGAVVSLVAIAGIEAGRDEAGARPGGGDRRIGPLPPFSEPAVLTAPQGEVDCAGVFYPLQVTVEPGGDAAPGALATATIRVTAARPLGRVELECSAGEGVELLGDRTISVERILPGETYERQIVARLPHSLERRVVEVTVRGWMNGGRLERSTIWNLVPAGPEPSREVLRADGTRVREVAARRIR